MNIIDIHTHTFPDRIAAATLDKLCHLSGTMYFTDGTEKGLSESAKKAGISCSVIMPVATSARQVTGINNRIIENSAALSDMGLMSFGAIHPDFEDTEGEILRLKKAGIKGLKLHPAYISRYISDPGMLRILRAAAGAKLPVTVHAGIDIGLPEVDYCPPAMIADVFDRVPDVTLILAHMGGWGRWKEAKEILSGLPLYYDTSFSLGTLTRHKDNSGELPKLLDHDEFADLCLAFGTDRVLFGTDSPWGDQAEAVSDILKLPLSDTDKDNILYNNAKRLLGI